jgi:hypothetical protein
VVSPAADATARGRWKALVLTDPVAKLVRNAVHGGFSDDVYDLRQLALAAIDVVVASMGFAREATLDEVIDTLAGLAGEDAAVRRARRRVAGRRAAGPDGAGHTLAVRPRYGRRSPRGLHLGARSWRLPAPSATSTTPGPANAWARVSSRGGTSAGSHQSPRPQPGTGQRPDRGISPSGCPPGPLLRPFGNDARAWYSASSLIMASPRISGYWAERSRPLLTFLAGDGASLHGRAAHLRQAASRELTVPPRAAPATTTRQPGCRVRGARRPPGW